MVGIPTRKANSVAAARFEVPRSIATKIVVAEREVPGKTPATICAIPTAMATRQKIWLLSACRSATRSANSIQKPPITSAQATGWIVVGSSKPIFFTIRPRTAVIRKATVSFAR